VSSSILVCDVDVTW